MPSKNCLMLKEGLKGASRSAHEGDAAPVPGDDYM
jgi:hypothetical protein